MALAVTLIRRSVRIVLVASNVKNVEAETHVSVLEALAWQFELSATLLVLLSGVLVGDVAAPVSISCRVAL